MTHTQPQPLERAEPPPAAQSARLPTRAPASIQPPTPQPQSQPTLQPQRQATERGARNALVMMEAPYKRYERPRAEGLVQAAGDDETLARWNVGGTGDPDFIANRPGYHPGARVVVTTRLVAGRLPQRGGQSLSQAGLLAQARSRGYWPLRICYEGALRRDPQAHGASVLRLSIARRGNVTRARLRDTELDQQAGECLRQALEQLRFRPGPSARLIAVDLKVEFWPGDAPLPSVGPPAGSEYTNPGTLDAKALRRALEVALAPIERCYAEGLERDSRLWGRLEVLVRLDDEGSLLDVDEAESRFPDRQVSSCVLQAMRRVAYPSAHTGKLEFVQGFRLGQPPPSSAAGLP